MDGHRKRLCRKQKRERGSAIQGLLGPGTAFQPVSINLPSWLYPATSINLDEQINAEGERQRPVHAASHVRGLCMQDMVTNYEPFVAKLRTVAAMVHTSGGQTAALYPGGPGKGAQGGGAL